MGPTDLNLFVITVMVLFGMLSVTAVLIILFVEVVVVAVVAVAVVMIASVLVFRQLLLCLVVAVAVLFPFAVLCPEVVEVVALVMHYFVVAVVVAHFCNLFYQKN